MICSKRILAVVIVFLAIMSEASAVTTCTSKQLGDVIIVTGAGPDQTFLRTSATTWAVQTENDFAEDYDWTLDNSRWSLTLTFAPDVAYRYDEETPSGVSGPKSGDYKKDGSVQSLTVTHKCTQTDPIPNWLTERFKLFGLDSAFIRQDGEQYYFRTTVTATDGSDYTLDIPTCVAYNEPQKDWQVEGRCDNEKFICSGNKEKTYGYPNLHAQELLMCLTTDQSGVHTEPRRHLDCPMMLDGLLVDSQTQLVQIPRWMRSAFTNWDAQSGNSAVGIGSHPVRVNKGDAGTQQYFIGRDPTCVAFSTNWMSATANDGECDADTYVCAGRTADGVTQHGWPRWQLVALQKAKRGTNNNHEDCPYP